MLVSYLVCIFTIFSIFGWIAECIYVSIAQGGWENRGFLFGPVCPIYGAGAVFAYLVYAYCNKSQLELSAVEVFLASMLVASLLEYITSYVLELIFHARWWDYSMMPLNLNGRICLPFAILFGAGGYLFYFYIAPTLFVLEGYFWTGYIEIFALVAACIFSADLSLTTSAQINLTQKLELISSDFDAVMSVAVADAIQAANGAAKTAAGAATTAELAAKSAAETLTALQRHALANIRHYSKPTLNVAAKAFRPAAGVAKKVRGRK